MKTQEEYHKKTFRIELVCPSVHLKLLWTVYLLFRSLENDLKQNKFSKENQIKNIFEKFVHVKPAVSYTHCQEELHEKNNYKYLWRDFQYVVAPTECATKFRLQEGLAAIPWKILPTPLIWRRLKRWRMNPSCKAKQRCCLGWSHSSNS